VVELAKKANVPVPANEAVYTLLKLHRMGKS
jgi:ketopantoate reductase